MTINGVTCINPSKIHEPSQYAHDDDPLPNQLDSSLSSDIELFLATGDLEHLERAMPSTYQWEADYEHQRMLRESIISAMYLSGIGQTQPARVKRRLSIDLNEEDAHAHQKRLRTDDVTDDNIRQTPANYGSPILDGARGTSPSSSSSTEVQSPSATLPPVTPADTMNDAELADTLDEVEPVATLDTSEDKEASTPAPSATEVPTANIDPILSNAPGSALSSALESAHPTAPVQGAVGTRVSAPAPAPTPSFSVTTRDIVPVVYNRPPGALAATVGVMPNVFGYPLALAPHAMPYHNMIPSYYPPPAMVAPMASAAVPSTVAAAPTAVVPQAAAVAVHPVAPIPATTVQPVHALPTVAAPAAPAAQPDCALWQSLVTTLDTKLWDVNHTLGFPIDSILVADYLNAFRTADRYAVLWTFRYRGNPNATPPRDSRDVRIDSVYTNNLVSYDGMNPVMGRDYRLRMLQAYPYLTIRALEQQKFEYIFHCNINGNIWSCPHCGKDAQGQQNLLTKHFERCRVLRAVENQVRAANA
ncbi:hypothetical protein CYLTODRAFT_445240 [Cylindrobasidium torrendii FP15055 ss-10]|uniref:Uncharacterized protein n=1 Tax=Cylindrobasidium torrendii FP15055 ss-10 TaxID=1314674 RepID=A0A0D7B7U1_9AGAR|nr:hypothetical protein CYLTODRAFT_445240 [Cylindrobasidium torrendii FP15055 ss-10]